MFVGVCGSRNLAVSLNCVSSKHIRNKYEAVFEGISCMTLTLLNTLYSSILCLLLAFVFKPQNI